MAEFASKGVAGSGLGLGIAGLSVALLQGANNGNGLLGGLFGNNNCGNALAAVMETNSALLAENASLKAENYSDKVAKEVYIQNQSELKSFAEPVTRRLNNTDVYLANMEARLKQAEYLLGQITKTVIPTAAICPEVMPRYNSWTAPTSTASAATTTPSA